MVRVAVTLLVYFLKASVNSSNTIIVVCMMKKSATVPLYTRTLIELILVIAM